MRQSIVALLLCVLVPCSPAQQPSSASNTSGTLPGYSPASAKTELDWEARFRAIPEAKRAHENMLQLAAHPHNVGSEAQRKNAEWVVAQYKKWGWDAHIEQFDVLYPTPKTMELELLGDKPYKAKLTETPLAEDPYTHETQTQLPGYNIYSADGDVTAPLVYANYGMREDYDELARNGISVKGAIVITRYGGGWRGLKPKLAYEHGAIGCIIYSDPADDGYAQGDVLPKGPMRPPQGVQRGSVSDAPLYSGDPLTPGWGSVPGAKRLAIKDAQTLMKIPVLPIGYGDAEPLLASLDGRTVPAAWRGGLPITYHFGPSTAKVHLKLAFDWGTKPVLDVIATLKGSVEPDLWIVRGNHYDGWVNGADDPISGQSGLLEEARALGELVKQGWRPKRTLIYAAWDGEEPGLLGSTEWAETHAEELTKHAALYVNSDESNRGFLNASGSHSLERLVNDVAKDVTDPETKASVWKREQAGLMTRGAGRPGAGARPANAGNGLLPIGAPGSGSDFTPFIAHLGVSVLNLGFGGEDRGGTYHSAYDTPWFVEHFGDKDALYGKALADTAGTLVMRFADADILPYDFRDLANTLKGYTGELKELNKQLQRDAAVRKRNIDSGAYALAADPRVAVVAPGPLPAPPDLDFSALDSAVAKLASAAESLYKAEAGNPSSAKLATVNAELALAERKLLSDQGLPRRPWMKHVLYAPGVYTGYAAKTIPGVREALEDGNYDEATAQLAVVSKAIENEAEYVASISAELSGQ